LTNPDSGAELLNDTLTPNIRLRSRIREWQQQQLQLQLNQQKQQLHLPPPPPPLQQQHQLQQRRGCARGGESVNASTSKATGSKLAEAVAASSLSAVASAAAAAPLSAPAKRVYVEWKRHKPEPAPAITVAQLLHAFLPFGAVKEEKSFVIFDKSAQKSKPFGFVEFRDAESAARAVAAKTIRIGAVAANVSFANAAR
jgi:hypothetical protein